MPAKAVAPSPVRSEKLGITDSSDGGDVEVRFFAFNLESMAGGAPEARRALRAQFQF